MGVLNIVIAVMMMSAIISHADNSEITGLRGDLVIHIVDDEAEWPPYTYYKRLNGKKTQEIEGFSIDVVSHILHRAGIKFTIELLPWKRALFNVAGGKKNQLILNSSYVKEREEDYLYSLSYYSLQHVIFYSVKKYPNGLVLKDIDDLNSNYKICGLRGYSYGAAGVDTQKVNLSFGTYGQLIHVLHERPEICDLFIEGYKILPGFKMIGHDYLADMNLKHSIIPGLASKGYHMLISKKLAYRHELKRILDEGILDMQNSGEMDKVSEKYGLLHHSHEGH